MGGGALDTSSSRLEPLPAVAASKRASNFANSRETSRGVVSAAIRWKTSGCSERCSARAGAFSGLNTSSFAIQFVASGCSPSPN